MQIKSDGATQIPWVNLKSKEKIPCPPWELQEGTSPCFVSKFSLFALEWRQFSGTFVRRTSTTVTGKWIIYARISKNITRRVGIGIETAYYDECVCVPDLGQGERMLRMQKRRQVRHPEGSIAVVFGLLTLAQLILLVNFSTYTCICVCVHVSAAATWLVISFIARRAVKILFEMPLQTTMHLKVTIAGGILWRARVPNAHLQSGIHKCICQIHSCSRIFGKLLQIVRLLTGPQIHFMVIKN